MGTTQRNQHSNHEEDTRLKWCARFHAKLNTLFNIFSLTYHHFVHFLRWDWRSELFAALEDELRYLPWRAGVFLCGAARKKLSILEKIAWNVCYLLMYLRALCHVFSPLPFRCRYFLSVSLLMLAWASPSISPVKLEGTTIVHHQAYNLKSEWQLRFEISYAWKSVYCETFPLLNWMNWLVNLCWISLSLPQVKCVSNRLCALEIRIRSWGFKFWTTYMK